MTIILLWALGAYAVSSRFTQDKDWFDWVLIAVWPPVIAMEVVVGCAIAVLDWWYGDEDDE